MAEIKECTICASTYDSNEHKPKVLHCGHVFCAQCLNHYDYPKVNNIANEWNSYKNGINGITVPLELHECSALRCVTEGTLLQWSALVWVTEFRSSAQNWKTEICGNCGSKTKYVKKYKYCFFYFYSHISTTKVRQTWKELDIHFLSDTITDRKKLEYQQKARTEQECFGVRKQNELKKMGKALFVNFVSVTEKTSIIIV